jgi:hypothetical protein
MDIKLVDKQLLTPSPIGEGELPLQLERVGVRFLRLLGVGSKFNF